MSLVVMTVRIMPEGPDVKFEDIKKKIEKVVTNFAGKGQIKFDEQPIGFGLSALNVLFATDEKNSNTDKLEADLRKIDGITSADVTDVRRAIG